MHHCLVSIFLRLMELHFPIWLPFLLKSISRQSEWLRSISLLLLSCFSRIRLCATPKMAAYWAPPSLGFSRQEHWSGLPFPSPKSTSNKYQRGCGEKGTLLHCWWECKLVEPLWRTVWRFLKKLEIELPYDPAIPLLGMKETHVPQCSLQHCL